MCDFEKVAKIGEGQYGVVYKAKQLSTGRLVALKRIMIDERDGIPSTALREIALLQQLNHKNIVKLEDVLHVDCRFYLIFELMDMDLGRVIKKFRPSAVPVNLSKSLFKQLIEGLFFCHTKRILHRDIKPQNLLLNCEGVLKIGDFGLARCFSLPIRPLTNEVITLWYRPPEVLFGDELYSMGADVWSAGCILAELLTGHALFQGDSEIGQIHEIFQKLGTPNQVTWPWFDKSPRFRTNFPMWKPQSLAQICPSLHPVACDLLQSIFVYDQTKRCTTKQVLAHEYLSDVEGVVPLVDYSDGSGSGSLPEQASVTSVSESISTNSSIQYFPSESCVK